MRKGILKSFSEIRANSSPRILTNESGFYDDFISYIKNNSRLLDRGFFIECSPQSWYYFDIEGGSSKVYEGNIIDQFKPMKGFTVTPKMLVTEFGVERAKYNTFFQTDGVKSEEKFFEKLLYRPFMRSIEKNVISGNYFDKSIFNTTDIITGTNDFAGLLKLVRYLKNKNENNVVVVNPVIMAGIVNTVTNTAYLNEYLLNKKIEGVEIIESLECPNTKIVGVDPTKICLALSPELTVRKLTTVFTQYLDYIFQVYTFVNGGDVFDSAVVMGI